MTSSAATPDDDARAVLARRVRTQAGECERLGSPLYAGLLEEVARDIEDGGVLAAVLAGHEDDPGPSALALRLLGAVHRLVLTGRVPSLARHYPSAGGDAGRPGAWPAFRRAVEEHFHTVRLELGRPVQTNEVGRCGALLGGFLRAVARAGLPVRLLEVGSSAGLNLRWDHYRYRCGGRAWGPLNSPVDLGDPFAGDGRPALGDAPAIVERVGCDPHPVDPTTAAGGLTLQSYVWPDMEQRRRRLLGAIEVSRRVPAGIERAGAGDWLERRLAAPAEGALTVVFHSVVMQYLERAERERVAAVLRSAGAAATPRAPLAWLRMEPARRLMEIRLTQWPGGADEHLADAGAHGRPVRWLAD